MLNADEALAVAVGLRTTVSVGGLGSTAVTALDKLTETVPSRLRARLEAVAATESSVSYHPRAADRAVFVALALACRANEADRFRTHPFATGAPDRPRDAQPHRMILLRSRWYLVACEQGASRWCIFAVERIVEVQPLGQGFGCHHHRTTQRPSPSSPWRRAPGSTASASESSPRSTWYGRWSTRRSGTCRTTARTASSPWGPTTSLGGRWLVHPNLDFDVIEPPELARRLPILGRWLVERYPRAAHEN